MRKDEIEKGSKGQSGMKSPTMPKEHFERSYSQMDGADLKYCSEMGAAEEYQKANEGLKNFVRKHKMTY